MIAVQPIPQAYDAAPPAGRERAGRPAAKALDGLLGLLATLLMAGAWATHVVACATQGLWTFLTLGLVVFPVALVHGVAVWLGL